jgi:hypothetical protein
LFTHDVAAAAVEIRSRLLLLLLVHLYRDLDAIALDNLSLFVKEPVDK